MLICHNCHTGNERRSNPDRSICLDSVCLWPIFHDIRSSYGNGNMHPLADISPKRDEDRVSTYPFSLFRIFRFSLSVDDFFWRKLLPLQSKKRRPFGQLDKSRILLVGFYIHIYLRSERLPGRFPRRIQFFIQPQLDTFPPDLRNAHGFCVFYKTSAA